MSSQPTVLVIGATGQTGRLIVADLKRAPGNVRLRLAAHKEADVERLKSGDYEAVHLDLDDVKTFGPALAGVDRLYLLTGYTVAMLHQSKTLMDAAKKARVQHIVHQGIFGEWDCTDPHFAWHQMIETYLKASGIAWTNLHPNYFMENLLGIMPIKGGAFPMYCGDRRVGWVAAKDLAAVAAAVLREGPERHAGQDYWLSPEVASGPEVATILTDVLGQEVRCDVMGPDDFKAFLMSSNIPIESWYAAGVVEFMRQVMDGRMGYIGTVRDDGPFVTGRTSTGFRQWATENRDALLKAASGG
ncbi:MAG TPA: NmrA family NAD(P)-binding protein [Candidatus Acidoferrum sp.]|nr:NmrA family NAD(P)-binding protein [Candidatus Acidoferrum sp.]